MKKSLMIAFLLSWCTAGALAQGGYVDDLYRGSTKKSKKAEAEAVKAASQRSSMPVNWSPARETAQPQAGMPLTAQDHGNRELVTSYEDALQRRLDAYKGYREMDDDYWRLMEGYYKMLSSKYDADLYNVITFGNEMWAEPKYISALFDGSDPAAGVRAKQFAVQQPQKQNVTINVTLGRSWWWDDPWDYYYWRNPWRYSYWGGPYWGPSWGWGWNSHWGWHGGWWGGGWYPPYHPPHWGGGGYYPGPNYGRPVIWGNRPGWNSGGSGPGYRPGSGGGSTGRPVYNTGGYRRNDNGTSTPITGIGGDNRRPGSSIRPGGGQNQLTPSTSGRPTFNGGSTGTQQRPSTERSYRRDVYTPQRTTTPQRTETVRPTTPQRTETPSYSAPSRGSSGSSGSSSGGSSGGGGGYRRR